MPDQLAEHNIAKEKLKLKELRRAKGFYNSLLREEGVITIEGEEEGEVVELVEEEEVEEVEEAVAALCPVR